MLKKITALAVLSILFMHLLSCSAGAECSSWYIKRNGSSAPSFPEDPIAMKALDCFFIDTDASLCGEKKIYLTFDAGYLNESLKEIVDTLNENDITAAFFVLDNLILKEPELIKSMAERGHLICNHTKNHKNLSNSSYNEISHDLESLEEICQEKAGVEMAKYFRFPEGKYSKEAIKLVQSLGYKTVFWSFAYEDWDNSKQPNSDSAMKKILSNTHCGAIMLFHPTSATNAKIFPDLIKAWRDMGYSFASLDELK